MENEVKFLQLFENVSKGTSKYITLDSLQVAVPYEVVNFRLYDSPYGRCLIADLAGGFWLVLPRRIGDTVKTEEQVKILNSKKYWMIFKGRHQQYRKMAIIEFKTLEQFMEDQAVDLNMPMVNFSVGANGFVQEASTQTEAAPIAPAGEATLALVEEPVKSGLAPKVTIKVKKERK